MASPNSPMYPATAFLDEFRISPGSIEAVLPGFSIARRFLFRKTNWDIGHIAGTAFLVFTLSNSIRYVAKVAFDIFWGSSRFFSTNVTVSEPDPLYRELNLWLAENVTQHSRGMMDAQSAGESTSKTTVKRRRSGFDELDNTKSPIQFVPGVKTRSWFWHKGSLFYLYTTDEAPKENKGQPSLPVRSSISLVCLGWTVKPTEKLLEDVKACSREEEESTTTIWTRTGTYAFWDSHVSRPSRPLETVDLEAKDKQDLVDDITRYLASRTYYSNRGIPYRRGYLLYGPPGTGKTSLSSAIAGSFNLSMYNMSLNAENMNDTTLEKLFIALPERCVVLLEDVDAASVSKERGKSKKQVEGSGSGGSSSDDRDKTRPKSQITLSGLLNVLDGVASAEGRILIMTTNHRNHLDEALIRPGRIDKEIYMGFVTREVAASIFLRMYTQSPEEAQASAAKIFKVEEKNRARGHSGFIELLDNTRYAGMPARTRSSTLRSLPSPGSPISPFVLQARRGAQEKGGETGVNELERMAITFSKKVPERMLTPAEVQGFLLQHREDALQALTKCDQWVSNKVQEKGGRDRVITLIGPPKSRDESENRRQRPRPLNRSEEVKQRASMFEKPINAEKQVASSSAAPLMLTTGSVTSEGSLKDEEENDGDVESPE